MANSKKPKVPVVTATKSQEGWRIEAKKGNAKAEPREVEDAEKAVEAALEALEETEHPIKDDANDETEEKV